VASHNSYAPLGDAANTMPIGKDGIERVVRRLLS
jgi:hypothetical protein